MKNINKVILATAVSLSLSAAVQAEEKVRLVISKTQSTLSAPKLTSSYTQSTSGTSYEKQDMGCLSAPNGEGHWCLELESSEKNQVLSQSSVGKFKDVTSSFEVVKLDSNGYSAAQVAKILNEDGRFGKVEVDYEFSISRQPSVTASVDSESESSPVNDADYESNQAFYMKSPDLTPVGLNIEALWESVGIENVDTKSEDAIDLLIVDTEFFSNPEFSYYDGRNFSTINLSSTKAQSRSDDYTPPVEVVEAGTACGTHGMSVSSIASAKMNNGTAMAGVTNNVNLHALRAVTCGRGFFSDVAASFEWAAGEDIEGVSPYEGKPGVISVSLGVNSTEYSGVLACPDYLQNAIDKAIDSGFTIVVAAGNDGMTTDSTILASCSNVITVGSLTTTGDLSSFSNRGDGIDVMAIGESIANMCNDSANTCVGGGTSYSTPLVSSSLAVIKKETGATDAQLKSAMEYTSSFENLTAECSEENCGSGLFNAGETFTVANLAAKGELNTITHTLAGKTECEQEWFIDNFGDSGRLCEMYNVKFMGGISKANTEFRLVSIGSNDSWETASKTEIGLFSNSEVNVLGLDVEGNKFGVQVCTNGTCGDVQDVNSSLATDEYKPVACK